jgi:hypothetical protein
MEGLMKVAVLVGLLLSSAAFVRADEITGFLADAKCAGAGKGAAAAHSGCAQKCVQGGEAVVLVTAEGKVYKIKNQEKVKNHAGAKATLQGKIDGDTIEVERGRPAE